MAYHVQLKPMIKAHSSGREKLVFSGISDVVIASVHSEKTRPKKLMKMMIIIVMNKSQEMKVLAVTRNLLAP